MNILQRNVLSACSQWSVEGATRVQFLRFLSFDDIFISPQKISLVLNQLTSMGYVDKRLEYFEHKENLAGTSKAGTHRFNYKITPMGLQALNSS